MTIGGVPDRSPFASAALRMPGLTGPSILPTVIWSAVCNLGYGLNVLLDDHSTMSAVAGKPFGVSWAIFVALVAVLRILGVAATTYLHRLGPELVTTIASLMAYSGVCAAVTIGSLIGTAPNGFSPFWWPAALAGYALWRLRSIVRDLHAAATLRAPS